MSLVLPIYPSYVPVYSVFISCLFILGPKRGKDTISFYLHSTFDPRCVNVPIPSNSLVLGGHQLGILQFNSVLTLTSQSSTDTTS